MKDNQLIFNCHCLKCNENHKKKINKDLIKRFASTCEFCNRDFNEFIHIYIYPYEHMSSWEKFNETLLPDKDGDYKHEKKVCKL